MKSNAINQDYLETSITASLDCLNKNLSSSRHAIGAEIEFFLRDQHGKLANLELSQTFLKEISELKNWALFNVNNHSKKIVSVSNELPHNRYHSVKYEHPPHLLELALSYETNLINLRESLSNSFECLEVAAQKSGAKLDFSPFSEPTDLDWNTINLISNQFENLHNSRQSILTKLHPSIEKVHANFSAHLAGTQFHISGYRWWNEANAFIERLYHSEAVISLQSFESENQFHKRWEKYKNVFSHMSLLGIPSLSHWTHDAWIKQMIIDNPFETDLFKMRDFQIIKPKWIGTLEYRADISTSNINLIIQQAALRFASYINAQKRDHKGPLAHHTLSELSTAWKSGELFKDRTHLIEVIKEQAWQALRERNLGEEGLL